ncbi:TPA: phosphoglucosamine mutase [Candidatus Woesearchaeota archaeon]|nr:phosphoglucosamine mutase [Candidatus Woesearchaeota archaeon]
MRKLFGTDGIRGRSNIFPMTAETALKLGQAIATVLRKHYNKKITAVIGKDTRRSCYIFEYALTSGLCPMGADVYLVGPMPTPAISHLTKSFAADMGIVISASHNPATDNGIKLFDSQGFKLPDDVEEEIENIMESGIDTSDINGTNVGKAMRIDDAAGRYIEFTKNSIKNMSLEGLKIVLDCANGAAYKVAPMIFKELGAEVLVLNNKPDGLNINKDCGSLHPDVIRSAVLDNKADIGIALDGDADRVIMVDEKGNNVDGDHLIAMCALDMKRRGKLKDNTVVVTVMTNIGFDIAMKQAGINVIKAKVGDRYVIDEMRKNRYSLGREQSGHIIFFNRSTTGDGTLSALQVLALIKDSGKPLSELAKCMKSYPQVLKNIRVKVKRPIEDMPLVSEEIISAENRLGNDGRVLVRYSGTENLCRVMLEGKDQEEINALADKIIERVKEEIGE